MAAFAALLGGAGQAATQYGQQMRDVLEQRREGLVSLAQQMAQMTSDPTMRAQHLQTAADLLAGKDMGKIVPQWMKAVQTHQQNSQALAQSIGMPAQKPQPAPQAGPAQVGQVPGSLAPTPLPDVPQPPAGLGGAFDQLIAGNFQPEQPSAPPAAQPSTTAVPVGAHPIQANPTAIPSIAAAAEPQHSPVTSVSVPPLGPYQQFLDQGIVSPAEKKYLEAEDLFATAGQTPPAALSGYTSPVRQRIAQLGYEQALIRTKLGIAKDLLGQSGVGGSGPITPIQAAQLSMAGLPIPAGIIGLQYQAPVKEKIDAETLERQHPGILSQYKINPQETPQLVVSRSRTDPFGTPQNVEGVQPGEQVFTAANGDIFIAPKVQGTPKNSDGFNAVRGQTRTVGMVSMADAAQRQNNGEVFKSSTGEPLDVTKLPSDTAFAQVARGGYIFTVPVTPGQKAVVIGNEVYPVTAFNMSQVGTGSGPQPLGPKSVGSSSTPTSITTGPDNIPIVTGATHTPNTSGAYQRGVPTRSPSPITPIIPAPQPQASTSTAAAQLSPAFPQQPALPPGTHLPPGTVTVGQDTVYRKRATPVRAVMTQVFGDPANPDIPSMETFAHLADDPGATKRIGTAIRLLQADEGNLSIVTNSNMSGWTANGGSGPLLPISVGVGANGEKINSSRTLTPEKAAEINSNLQKAMSDLKTPEERQAVIASLKAYEEASGLRSLISSGGALASIATIQKTLPIIGMNTFSAQDYKDRLRRLAEDGINGQWGIPPNYLGADIVQRMNAVRSSKSDKQPLQPISGTGTTAPKVVKWGRDAKGNPVPLP